MSLLLAAVLGAALSARADAALVLSGDVDYLRLQHAIELYKQKATPILVLTGAGVGGDSALAMKRIAIGKGVPEASILIETRSTSTHENLAFATPLLLQNGLKRVFLVTSESHMQRALLVAQKAAPDVTWIPEPVADAARPNGNDARETQEWLKRLYYALRGWT